MTYDQLLDDIVVLKKRGFECGSIGRSVLGREIPFIKVGDGRFNIIVQAAIHAREYATASIAMMQIQYLATLDLGDFCFYFVPMSNPDGVDICIDGLDSVDSKYIRHKLSTIVPNKQEKIVANRDFSDLKSNVNLVDFDSNNAFDDLNSNINLVDIDSKNAFGDFKANANCVDLNCNFDARWGMGDSNIFYPDTENFVGNFAGDQPETRALMRLCHILNPVATMSYHSRGRIIYWDFFAEPERAARDQKFAEALAVSARYQVGSSQDSSAGGFKDWCVQHLQIPSFTIEFFDEDEKYPISQDQIINEFLRTRDMPVVLMESLLSM